MSFERWENQMADDFDHGQHDPCEHCEDEECTCEPNDFDYDDSDTYCDVEDCYE